MFAFINIFMEGFLCNDGVQVTIQRNLSMAILLLPEIGTLQKQSNRPSSICISHCAGDTGTGKW
jgi:hypothetical protein